MTTDPVNLITNLSIGGTLALVFYLTVKNILVNNRETINRLLDENKVQREEFVKVISNHLVHETAAQIKLTEAIDHLDKSVKTLPDAIMTGIKSVYDPKLYKKRAIVDARRLVKIKS